MSSPSSMKNLPRNVVAVLPAQVADKRLAHRLGEVSPRAARTAGTAQHDVPAEMLAARTVRHVDSHQVVAVAVDQVAHGLTVVRRKLLAALERRERFPRRSALARRGEHMPLAGVGDAPPVRRGVEDAREERRLRRPREEVVDVGVLVLHPERAVLAPVRMPVVRERAEHREEVHACGGHVPRVLLLRLPLPEHHRRDGLPVMVQPRRAVQLRHAPPRPERR